MKTTLPNVHSPAAATGVSFSKKLSLSLLITLGAWSAASADTTTDEPKNEVFVP